MVSQTDFGRVRTNEAYMLVYSLRKPENPVGPKKIQGIAVQTGQNILIRDQSVDTKLTSVKQTTQAQPLTKSPIKQLPHHDQKQKHSISQEDKLATQPIITNSDFSLQKGVSNGVGLTQVSLQQNSKRLSEILSLKRTTSHPLFGAPEADHENHQIGPAWYVGEDSQLQKRKPEESSRTSGSKKFINPHKSGMQRLKDMRRKLKTFSVNSSLPLSRVTSMDVRYD